MNKSHKPQTAANARVDDQRDQAPTLQPTPELETFLGLLGRVLAEKWIEAQRAAREIARDSSA